MIRAATYALLRNYLPQDARNTIKARMGAMRSRLAPLYRALYGVFDAGELRAHLSANLPSDFDILMVHSSMDAMVPMYRDTVFDLMTVLLDLVGPDRTLAMPAFFFGGASYSPEEHYRRIPLFDARATPSEVGLLTELFRRRKDVQRSLHPTHSVCARGPLAQELVARHHTCGTTFGPDSPFDVMTRHKTVILGIGTHFFRVLTQVHAAEDRLGSRFPVPRAPHQPIPVTLKARGGQTYEYHLPPCLDPRYPRRIERLVAFLSPGCLRQWRFHGVPFFSVPAAEATSALVEAASAGNTIYEHPKDSV